MKHWLYVEFWWAIHNLIAHPLSQIFWWFSLCGTIKKIESFSNWIHDYTIPVHKEGEGRG